MLAEQQKLYSSPQLEPLLTADGRPVSVVRAETLRQKEEAFRIRYEVYCKHLAYESSQKNARGLETDQFDGWSRHYLVRDDLSGRYVGTIRLVEPQHRPSQSIPMEKIYTGAYDSEVHSPNLFRSGSYIEISRLAVLPDAATDFSNYFSIEVARLLYLSALAHFHANDRLDHLLCLMEKRLARRLGFMGLPFVQIGEFFEFKGQRAPFYLGKTGVRERLKGDARVIYNRLLADELGPRTMRPEMKMQVA